MIREYLCCKIESFYVMMMMMMSTTTTTTASITMRWITISYCFAPKSTRKKGKTTEHVKWQNSKMCVGKTGGMRRKENDGKKPWAIGGWFSSIRIQIASHLSVIHHYPLKVCLLLPILSICTFECISWKRASPHTFISFVLLKGLVCAKWFVCNKYMRGAATK